MHFDILEIAGTALGLLYLWLEYRASAWLWVVSIAMPAIYLAVYYRAGLYADFGISVYYILASVYGLWAWLHSARLHQLSAPEANPGAGISRTPRRVWLPMMAVGVAVFLDIGLILSRLTNSTVPWADALTTALSIMAMWMLARKYLEQWLVWIVADLGCAALYLYKGLDFTAGLYLLYAVVAALGYRRWQQMMKQTPTKQ